MPGVFALVVVDNAVLTYDLPKLNQPLTSSCLHFKEKKRKFFDEPVPTLGVKLANSEPPRLALNILRVSKLGDRNIGRTPTVQNMYIVLSRDAKLDQR